MIKIIKLTFQDKLFETALEIRDEVFVKEQHVAAELEHDQYDQTAQHYLVYYDNNPIATARWRTTDKGVKLERFAVLAGYRNKGTGSVLLQQVIEDVIPLSKPIYLHAQLSAVDFYLMHGFNKIGSLFTEAGIEHYKMEYNN